MTGKSALLFPLLSLLALLGASCVQLDSTTNEPLPRGDQRYPFEVVEEKAEELEIGMHRRNVLLLMGSPAEKDDGGSLWVYLPERPAILVPGRALRLRFEGDFLAEFGFHAIVLGQQF